MEKTELQNVISSRRECCDIIDKTESSITFRVDDVEPRCRVMDVEPYEGIIRKYLVNKQIAESLHDVITYDFGSDPMVNMGFDVLYKCILQCFSEHRPLVLTPDVIWLVINQGLASWINDNAERFRHKIVRHEGKKQVVVKSSTDIFSDDTDWNHLLEGFYSQLNTHLKDGLADRMVCDFSTTKNVDRAASIITLMDAVKNYFEYVVTYCICGIPSVTLRGNVDDWRLLEEKILILNDFELSWWHDHLAPVMHEFVRSAEGHPNKAFWQNIVLKDRPKEFSHLKAGGCIPEWTDVDGWFLVFFPFIDGEEQTFESHNKDWSMSSEMSRVDFKYQVTDGVAVLSETPMELWAGLVGVHEDKSTYALTPKTGWFVRVSHKEDESLMRLKQQEEETGEIELYIDEEVPKILKKLGNIKFLILRFNGPVEIPSWLDEMHIERFYIQGGMSLEYENELRSRFKDIEIFNENKDNPWDD